MQVGDTVLLKGRVVKVAEDGNPMNNLVILNTMKTKHIGQSVIG